MPFQPWSRAVYDYNSQNNSKYDPEGYCLPPGGPRLMATPYPMEIIQQPDQKRILMIFSSRGLRVRNTCAVRSFRFTLMTASAGEISVRSSMRSLR